MSELHLATARIDYQAKPGEVVIDTTVKSAKGMDRDLAPTWSMVMDYKAHKITWEQYEEAYVALIRQRYVNGALIFSAICDTGLDVAHIKKRSTVVLTCYCNLHKQAHCHRLLLVNIFSKIAIARGLNFVYEGERS